MNELFRNGRPVVYSSAHRSLAPIDAHREKMTASAALASNVTGGENGQRLDADSWLPAASRHYCLSSNIRDYVIVPVPAIMSDIPNTNGVAMPKGELLQFRPDSGRTSFKTWKGKPCFREHANQDITQAKGVILDTYVSPVRGFPGNIVKVMMLAAYDRTKDHVLAESILRGEENAYSMGAYFEGYTCSICGADKNRCKHTDPRSPLKQDPVTKTLAYRNIYGIEGFELSSVSSPAYIVAISDVILGVNT